MKSIIRFCKKNFEWLVMGIWLLAMIFADFSDVVPYVAAFVGLIYCGYFLFVFTCRPIKRDWLMVYGRFVMVIINIVMLLPFVLYSISSICGAESGDASASGKVAEGFWDVWYNYFDPGNQRDVPSWSTVFAIFGFFLLNGVMISTLTSWIDRRRQAWFDGELRYSRTSLGGKQHYVVIGGGDVAISVVRELAERNDGSYIFILTSREASVFRRELFSDISGDERFRRRVIIYYGNSTSPDEVKDLYLDKAKEVYLIGDHLLDDEMDSYNDIKNIKCLRIIAQQREGQKTLLPCRVMFESQSSFSVFQYSEISSELKQTIAFKPVNYYELWAQKVLVGWQRDSKYLPMDGWDGIHADSNDYVHLIVVGMSKMGLAMAVEAAHLAHYPNYVTKGIKSRITFIDKNASGEGLAFRARFKELFALSHWAEGRVRDGKLVFAHSAPELHAHLGGDFMDVEWEFINADVEDSCVQGYIKSATESTAKATIAFCLKNPSQAFAAAIYSERDIFNKAHQILVYNRYGDALVEELIQSESRLCNPFSNKMRAFGIADGVYSEDLVRKLETIAQRNGEEYSSICKQLKKKGLFYDEGSGLGKSEIAKWWSNVYNGQMLWTKLRSWPGGVTDQIDVVSQVEHNRWNMEQLLMGFRPMTEEEQRKVLSDLSLKNEYKGRMVLLDLCSNDRLKKIDPVSTAYDEGFARILPELDELSQRIL